MTDNSLRYRDRGLGAALKARSTSPPFVVHRIYPLTAPPPQQLSQLAEKFLCSCPAAMAPVLAGMTVPSWFEVGGSLFTARVVWSGERGGDNERERRGKLTSEVG